MYNVFFDDAELNLSTKLKTFIEEDRYGYYIDLFVRKIDVTKLMAIDIIPNYDSNRNKFNIRVRLNNNTKISLNGIRINYLGDELLKTIPLKSLSLKEFVLKRYSNKRKNPARYCYATKAIFKLDAAKARKVLSK